MNESPRAAAALLRLCVQRLCEHLGDPKKNLDENIRIMAEKGLDSRVKKALDIVRVTGNRAVHPAHINSQADSGDDRTDSAALFRLVNIIADKMIGQEKDINEMYDELPRSVREGIARRDGKEPTTTNEEQGGSEPS